VESFKKREETGERKKFFSLPGNPSIAKSPQKDLLFTNFDLGFRRRLNSESYADLFPKPGEQGGDIECFEYRESRIHKWA
jgi:hypothetical protein